MQLPKTWLTILCACANATVAGAGEFTLEEGVSGKYNLHLTAGTQIRAESPHADQYAALPSLVVPGVARGRLTGFTGGSDLNYEKGQPVSTVLKASFDLDIRKDQWGFFVSGLAWDDLAQGHRSVAYGNYPNGFTPNVPLSDKGFSDSARFRGAQLHELYVHGRSAWGEGTLQTRVGRQFLDWGGSVLTPGGIHSAIHPADYAAAVRPGALASEGKVPVGMVSLKLESGSAWNWEGFLALESRKSVIPGCGTYFDVSAYSPEGCDMATVALNGTTSERDYYNTGLYVHRNPDVDATGRQYGLAISYRTDAKSTLWKWYALNTANSLPSQRLTVNSLPFGSPLRGNYANLYLDDVKVLGMSFQSQTGQQQKAFGEIALRLNQPISYNASDLLSAFLVNQGPLTLSRGTGLVPVGGTFDAYERFRVLSGSFGVSQMAKGVLGADLAAMTGELAFSHVSGLPAPELARFGRPQSFGAAAAPGYAACTDAVPGKTCSGDGYVSGSASGLRALFSLSYGRLMPSAVVTPSVYVALDLKGWSWDGTISEGRRLVRPGVRIEWQKSRFIEMQYTRFSGGRYSLIADRDFYALVAGVRF